MHHINPQHFVLFYMVCRFGFHKYFQKKYNITPDDLKIEDLHDIYKLNIPLLDSNVKLKDPIFYNLYIGN